MESAQLRMERMLPELRDLEQKKTFTKAEISAIVTQRNYYEALTVRPKSSDCYLKYIEYEKRLEKLRRLRVGRYGRVKGRTTLSDYSIPLHILSLYSTAAKRFPESLELWISYIAYSLTQQSSKLVSRVLSAAIAAHPTHSNFWVMAAQFEADGDETGKGGGNFDGARKLLMRGLRLFKETASLPLWLEWIRIELNLIQIIEKRRQAFGLANPRSDQQDSSTSAPTADIPLEQAVETTDKLELLPHDLQTDMTTLNRDVNNADLKGQAALLSGALVKVVLENCFQAVPSFAAVTATLPLLHAFDSSLKIKLLDFVYSKISELYPDSSEALVLIATRPLLSYSKNGKTLAASGEELVDLLSCTVDRLQKTLKEYLNMPSMSEEVLKCLVEIRSLLKGDELRKYVTVIINRTVAFIKKRKPDASNLDQFALSQP